MSTAPSPVPARPYRPRSIFGPLVLICIGLLFLAKNVGWISSHTLFWWFSRWWPALLILWGLVKVLEYAWAHHKGEPAPRGIGGGGIVFLIFFVMFGLGATGLSNINLDRLRNMDFDCHNDWTFLEDHYPFTENVAQPLIDATQVNVIVDGGDIGVSPSPDAQAHLSVRKSLRSGSQNDANKLNDSTHAKFVQQGKLWILDLTGGNFEHGRFNLDLQLPSNIALSVKARRGDIRVTDRAGEVELSTDCGGLTAKSVKGNVALHVHRGNVVVDDITGNVQIDGNGENTTVNNVTGALTVNGEYDGETHYSKVGGQVRFKSHRTDLQFAKLDGEFNMGTGNLRADSITGPFSLQTRSKSVRLEGVTGDVHIDDTNDNVEIQAKAPLGTIDINSTNGGIEVSVPATADFQVDAESRNASIMSDFSLDIDNHRQDATAHGNIGKGGLLMRLRAKSGTIQIKKRD